MRCLLQAWTWSFVTDKYNAHMDDCGDSDTDSNFGFRFLKLGDGDRVHLLRIDVN